MQEYSNKIQVLDLYDSKSIVTRSFKGYFRDLRIKIGLVLLLCYFGFAWLSYDGHQALLFDLPERKFYVFFTVFWSQDFIFLSWLLIISAFTLFFVTVLSGRVWCGYACPQSVFSWIFMWVEKTIQGDRNSRIKLKQSPLNQNKFLKILSTHVIWLLISLSVAVTFVGYFSPIRELVYNLFVFNLSATELFWLCFLTLATYINAGYLREQVCIYMCPYARFQSVMFDKDTLIISYDASRGEQRGKRAKSEDYKAKGLGDCVDCLHCVQVCPAGIDIRDGLQIECISCAACVDACNSIMSKLGYKTGLVKYTTENETEGLTTKVIRPRLVGYVVVLTLMLSLFSYFLYKRSLVELNVLKDRTFRENYLGDIENIYTLRIMNKSQKEKTFSIDIIGNAALKYSIQSEIKVASGGIASLPVAVSLPYDNIDKQKEDIEFIVQDVDEVDNRVSTKNIFFSPQRLR